jgi:PhnB protein
MRGAPEGWHSITPRLITANPEALVAFLRRAFGAVGELNTGRPTELRIGDSNVMVSGTFEGRGPTEAFLYLYVEDADGTYAQAISAGGRSLEVPVDTPYGDRRATVEDPGGNVWQIATRNAREG